MWKVLWVLLIFVAAAYSQVNDDDMEYYLWNARVSNESINTNQFGNNIINTAPVKILVHGWTDSIDSFWYPGARETYTVFGANVICVDWSRHSQQLYSTSVARLPAIAAAMGRFIIGLSNVRGIPLDQFHLLGHSLGGQLVGLVGKNIQSQARTNLGRITGLDPAGPSFDNAANSNRLDQCDANEVDTILTDSGLLGLATSRSLGQVNFWPNGGGSLQPGCSIGLCSHNRGCFFFIEGILSNNFVSRRCTSWTNFRLGLCNSNPTNRLGQNVDFSTWGDFYLTTKSQSPFAQG